MTFDIHNVFFSAVTLTQPVFMGGKIVAMNKITGYAEELARQLNDSEAENVIYAVDAAYWMVVSLKAKEKLARSYVNLLDTLSHNVGLMLEQGVATRSDMLSVDVKLNSARVDLVKVENGLSLARMALAQVCGLPVNSVFALADEDDVSATPNADIATQYNMEDVYARRPDLRALELGVNIAGQQKRVAMSSMLPNVAVVGAYSFSNPNMYDGFSKRFAGAFSVGATVTIPIWHWGGNYNKYKAAASEETIMKLRLEDARDMIASSGEPGLVQGSGGISHPHHDRRKPPQGRRQPAHRHYLIPRGHRHDRQRHGGTDGAAEGPLRANRRHNRRASLQHISEQSPRHPQILTLQLSTLFL